MVSAERGAQGKRIRKGGATNRQRIDAWPPRGRRSVDPGEGADHCLMFMRTVSMSLAVVTTLAQAW